jgi:pimeloyl-ACP methyl ester carboxylesterase
MSSPDVLEVPARGLLFPARVTGPADAPVVLLLHGFPQTSLEWRAQLPALAEAGFRAVAFDQRGYAPGARPEQVEAYRADELVADVLAIADAIGAERFHLVGHDWGGAVAWYVAGRHPARVATLTAVSQPHPLAHARAIASGGEQARMSEYIPRFRQAGAAEEELLADDARGLRELFAAWGDLPEPDPYLSALREPGALTAALNWYRALRRRDAEQTGPIAVPTMFVWGADDPILGREAAEATAALVDGPYRFEVLDGVSHWLPELAAEQLNRRLLEHLEAGS